MTLKTFIIKNLMVAIRIPRFIFLVLFLWSALLAFGQQQNRFSMNYAGPDTVWVEDDCTGLLNWGDTLQNPEFTPLIAGLMIQKTTIEISGGYMVNDRVPAGDSVKVTYKLLDNQGQNSSFTFTIYFSDSTPPAFDPAYLPVDVTVGCGNTPMLGPAAVSDNCTAFEDLTIDISDDIPIDYCTGGVVERTYTATDAWGNSATYVQYLHIEADNSTPLLIEPAADLYFDCDNGDAAAILQSWIDNRGGAVVSDNCPQLVWSVSPSNLELVSTCIGPVAFTFTASDYCGNQVSTTAVFEWRDNQAPQISRQAQRVFHYCDGSNILELFDDWLLNYGFSVAEDNCVSETNLQVSYRTFGQERTRQEILDTFLQNIENGCENNLLFGGQSYDGVLAWAIVEFVYTDPCGNDSSTQSSFVVIDTILPSWETAPQDIQIVCSDQANLESALNLWYQSHGGAVAADLCGFVEIINNPDLEDLKSAFRNSQQSSCGRTGEVSMQVKAVDACGNVASEIYNVTFSVSDTAGPVLVEPPMPVSIECTPDVDLHIRTLIDNALNGRWEDACGDVLLKRIFWTDSKGNMGEALKGEYANYPLMDSFSCTWTLYLTLEVEDECGNTDRAQGVIEVWDGSSPVFSYFPPDITVNCGQVPEAEFPVVSDNCRVNLNLSLEENSTRSTDDKSCDFYNYQINRIWIATDACGNEIQKVQKITVQDTTPPQFNLPSFQNLTCLSDTTVQWSWIRSQIVDNCAEEVRLELQQYILPGACIGDYRIERQWRATDYCNNSSSFVQQIFVRDDIRPEILQLAKDTLVACASSVNLEEAFAAWIENRGGAELVEYCSTLKYFAATPGTYQINDPASWPGSMPVLVTGTCEQVYFIDQLVDFVFYDDCNNAVVLSARFRVEDSEPPVIVDCTSMLLFDNTPGTCEAIIDWTPATAYDVCTGDFNYWQEEKMLIIQSAAPGNLDSIVFPLNFEYSFTMSAGAAIANAQIRVTLESVDAEGAGEFFHILGENGIVLGRTSSTIIQCGNSVTTLTLNDLDINSWFSDGVAQFRLVPNVPIGQPGRTSVNDVCSQARAKLQLSFDWSQNGTISREWRINGGQRMAFDWNSGVQWQLEVGTHLLEQYATDCWGNEAVCIQTIEVRDVETPALTCPTDIFQLLMPDSCEIQLSLPSLLDIQDNCGPAQTVDLQTPATLEESLISFAMDPDLKGFIAIDKTLEFTGVQANATGNSVQLQLSLLGDVGTEGDYFTIYDEDGAALGNTEIGQAHVTSGDCNAASTIIFDIPVSNFNKWAADGKVVFEARANRNFTIPPGGPLSGINPCDLNQVIEDGDNDGISYITGRLLYRANPIYFSVSGATSISKRAVSEPDLAPLVTLRAGENVVRYFSEDVTGNEGACSFHVDVIDSQAPVAKCKNAIVYINPSGLIDYILSPAEVDNGSFDNCQIVHYNVIPNRFTCQDVNNEFQVDLYVEDAAGGRDSCVAQVRISGFNLQPEFELDICKPEALRLFGNIPPGPPGNVYLYRWTGPNNFLSFEENPVILNPGSQNAGTYILEITGSQGCSAIGSITIAIPEQLGIPNIIFEETVVCDGQPIFMETQLFSGNVQYQWYRGTVPNGVLVGESGNPAFSLVLPPGNYSFYVVARNNQCTSLPSVARNVRVLQQVIAQAEPDYIEICEGEKLQLGSTQSGSEYTYQWIGPNGFDQKARQVLVSESVVSNMAGIYTLFIWESGCPARPVDVEVVVKSKPNKPIIQYNPIFCPGQSLEFKVNNVPDANVYRWVYPDNTIFNTLENQLLIQQASSARNGFWYLQVIKDGCISDLADPVFVEIEDEYFFSINQPLPVCDGDSVSVATLEVPGARYRWYNALGEVGSDASIRIKAQTGFLNLEVITEKNCKYELFTQIQTIPPPNITALSSDAVECMDGSKPVCLFSSIFPPDPGNYVYTWSGPSFSSNLSSPCIPNATSANSGTYSLGVINGDGCRSELKFVDILIKDVPTRPVIERAMSYCEGETIELNVANYGPNAQYFWNTPEGTRNITGNPILQLPNAQPLLNSGAYTVRVLVNGCLTEESALEWIQVFPTPSRPEITASSLVCEGDSIRLSTSSIGGARYIWEGPQSIDINSNEVLFFPAGLENAGTYRVRYFVNGCPSEFSIPAFVQVNPQPKAPSMESSVQEICIDQAGKSVELCIAETEMIPGARYTWYDANNDMPLHGGTLSRCLTLQDFSAFTAGNQSFYVLVTKDGCTSDPGLPLNIRMDRFPNEFADAGVDLLSCGTDQATLNALPVSISNGRWTASESTLRFENEENPKSPVIGLFSGQNELIWSLSYLSCQDFDRDTVQVFYQTEPVVNDDRYTIPFASFAALNILNNDQLPINYQVTITKNPLRGSLTPQPNGGYEYLAAPNFVGEDYFDYEVCATGCPGLCSTARVYLEIGDASICDAPNIITPNNDGTNDVFFIPCLSGGLYPNNRVVVFNEWGGVVLDESPYSNNWQGTYKGQELPVGTYFYNIQYGEGRQDAKGFLVIKR